MSQDSDPLMERHVDPEARAGGVKIRCPMRGCEGTMYTLKPGELLSRRPRGGWTSENRLLECPECQHRQTISVQVKAR